MNLSETTLQYTVEGHRRDGDWEALGSTPQAYGLAYAEQYLRYWTKHADGEVFDSIRLTTEVITRTHVRVACSHPVVVG